MVFALRRRKERGGEQMKWKNLKSFAIAVLLVLNVLFGILVYIRYTDENYYDKELTENMTALLSESDIVLAGNALSDKIVKLNALVGTVSAAKTADALTLISGASPESEGEALVCRAGNAVYSHDGKSAFSYKRSDISEPDATGAVSVANAEEEGRRAADAVWKFLSLDKIFTGEGKYKSKLVCRDIRYSLSGGFFAAELALCMGGFETDNILTAYLRDGVPLMIEGSLPLSAPDGAMAVQEIGMLTVLLDEKAYVDTLPVKKKRILSQISYSYITWFDMNGKFYFTPICELRYESGELSRYDMITGERL